MTAVTRRLTDDEGDSAGEKNLSILDNVFVIRSRTTTRFRRQLDFYGSLARHVKNAASNHSVAICTATDPALGL